MKIGRYDGGVLCGIAKNEHGVYVIGIQTDSAEPVYASENLAYVERIIREVVVGSDCDVFWNRNIGTGPIIAGVNVSDTFTYACADSEDIKAHEIDDLVAEIKRDPIYGEIVWAAKKRNRQPIREAFENHATPETRAIFDSLPKIGGTP